MAVVQQNVPILLRYLYLGSKECSLVSKRKPLIVDDTIDDQLGFIANMVTEGYEDFPLRFIKKVQ